MGLLGQGFGQFASGPWQQTPGMQIAYPNGQMQMMCGQAPSEIMPPVAAYPYQQQGAFNPAPPAMQGPAQGVPPQPAQPAPAANPFSSFKPFGW